MKSIDKEILAGYNAGIERGRLRTGIGLLEFARSKELLLRYLPKPPAVIYDLGGGYGEYAWWLASLGYRVHLFDLSEKNIAMAEELSAGGFTGHRVHGVVGAAWLAPDLDRLWEDAAARAALMKTVGLLDEHPDILGLSTHLLAVSKKES